MSLTTNTIKVKASVLSDADVTYMSMVERPANRIPFKMKKSGETDMNFNLQKLFTARKAEESASAVVAVVVRKGESEKYKAPLAEAGIEVYAEQDLDDQDVTLLVVKEDAVLDAEELTTFKMPNEMGVMVSNVKKYFAPWGTADKSFIDSATAKSFFPSLETAVSAFMQHMDMLMDKDEVKQSPTEEVQTLLNEFNQYVLALVNNLPDTVFKMEKLTPLVAEEAVEDVESAEPVSDDSIETASEGVAKAEEPADGSEEPVEAVGVEAEVSKSEDGGESAAVDTGGEVTEEAEVAEVTKSEESEEPTSIEAVISKAVGDALGSLSTQIGESISSLTSQVEELKKANDATVAKQEELSEMLGVTTIGESDASSVTKSDTTASVKSDTDFEPMPSNLEMY